MNTLQQLRQEYVERPSQTLKDSIIDYILEFGDEDQLKDLQELREIEKELKINPTRFNCDRFMYTCGEFSKGGFSWLLDHGCKNCKEYAFFELRRKFLSERLFWNHIN